MGFVMNVSFVIASILIVKSQAVSIGSAEKTTEGNEISLEAAISIVSLAQDCFTSAEVDDSTEFSFGPNMTRTDKCLMGCIFKKTELISKDNKLTLDGLNYWESLLADDSNENTSNADECMYTNKEVFSKCSHVTDKDVCDAAFKIMTCLQEACPSSQSK